MKLLRILAASIKQSVIYDMQYRVHFLINVITTVGWMSLSILTLDIIGSRISHISQNWTQEEYILIWSFFTCSEMLVWFLFRENVSEIPKKIIHGDLDLIITKPFSSKFLSSIGKVRIEVLFSFLFSYTLQMRSLYLLNPSSALTMIFIASCLIIFTSITLYSLYISFLSLSFWLLGASNIDFFFTQIITVGTYPIQAFGKVIQFFFTFIVPLAFISTVPAEAVIDYSPLKIILIIMVAILTYCGSELIWKLGLRSYTSASS